MSTSISAFYYLSLNKQCVPQHSSFWKSWLYNVARSSAACRGWNKLVTVWAPFWSQTSVIRLRMAAKGMATPPDYEVKVTEQLLRCYLYLHVFGNLCSCVTFIVVKQVEAGKGGPFAWLCSALVLRHFT